MDSLGERKGGRRGFVPRHAPPHKNHFKDMSVEEEIKAHTQRVEAGDPIRYCQICPGCGAEGAARVHDCRPRTFRVIIEGIVRIMISGVWRWKCMTCGKRFTDYPRLPCRTSVS